MRYLKKPPWTIVDQIDSSLIFLTPWFQLSISVRGIHEGEEVCLGWSPQQGPPQCDDAHVVVPRTQVCKSVNYPDGE